jgi:hypothetical protein
LSEEDEGTRDQGIGTGREAAVSGSRVKGNWGKETGKRKRGDKKGGAVSGSAFLLTVKKRTGNEKQTRPPLSCRSCNLYQFYVVRCRTFLTLCLVKADALTFLQRLEATGLNSAVMNEQIATTIFFDESEAFLVIEPFHFSF